LFSEEGVSEPSDLELVFLSRQGNKAAFGQLVLRYQPMAQRLATRVIGNGDLAQELVQDAMLQAYLPLEKLNDPTRFMSANKCCLRISDRGNAYLFSKVFHIAATSNWGSITIVVSGY